MRSSGCGKLIERLKFVLLKKKKPLLRFGD